MKSNGFAALVACVGLVFSTGCINVEGELVNFEPPTGPTTDGGQEAATDVADGEACATHDECTSGVCVPVLPSQAEKRGVCWGPGMQSCLWVLFDEGVWSKAPCRELGLTDMLCPPVLTEGMKEQCVIPSESPSGDFPYDYICCETTLAE